MVQWPKCGCFNREWPKLIEHHPMFFTSLVAIVTAAINLGIIYCMNRTDGLDHGLGLASIGIVTFLGTLLSSSIFEEHRHDHGVHSSKKVIVGKDVPNGIKNDLREIDAKAFSEKISKLVDKYKDSAKPKIKEAVFEEYTKKSDFVFVSKDNPRKDEAGNFLEGIIVGTGIMRKSLAASLVITYIVLIGLSFSAGTLYDSLGVEPDTEETDDASVQSILGAVSNFVFSGQIIESAMGQGQTIELSEKIQTSDSADSDDAANPSDNESTTPKSVEQLLLEKNPETLVGHFTIVITAVVGFYFGSNTLKTLLDARAKERSNDSDTDKKYEELKKTIAELKEKSTDKTLETLILLLKDGKINKGEFDKLRKTLSI